MQRRAAAAYVVLLLALSLGAYGVIATESVPSAKVTETEAAYTLQANDSVTIDGRTYNVTSVTNNANSKSAVLSWINDSARYTRTWANGSTAEYKGANYTVSIPNVSDPSNATLVAISPGENATILNSSDDSQQYVAIDENGDGTYDRTIPIEEYNFTTIRIEEGDTLENYPGENTTTVANISKNRVLLEWQAPRKNTLELAQAANRTLNGKDFMAYFPDGKSEVRLVPTAKADKAYFEEVRTEKHFDDRMRGVWSVMIVSVISAIILVGLAYLPRKDT